MLDVYIYIYLMMLLLICFPWLDVAGLKHDWNFFFQRPEALYNWTCVYLLEMVDCEECRVGLDISVNREGLGVMTFSRMLF